jgi:hypothetical protein
MRIKGYTAYLERTQLGTTTRVLVGLFELQSALDTNRNRRPVQPALFDEETMHVTLSYNGLRDESILPLVFCRLHRSAAASDMAFKARTAKRRQS